MRGFKLFFKILKANIIATLAYLTILVVSSVLIGLQKDEIQTQSEMKMPIYYVEVNRDLLDNLPGDETQKFDFLLDNDLILLESDDPLTNGLYDYIVIPDNPQANPNGVVVDKQKSIKPEHASDANFYQIIHGILILPSNLSELAQEESFFIIHTYFKNTFYTEPLAMAIDKYLNTYYTLQASGIPGDLVSKVNETLTSNVDYEISRPSDKHLEMAAFYFNFATYVITAVIILIIGIVIFEIKRTAVFRRIQISPYHQTKFLFEIILASMLMALGLVVLTFCLGAITNPTVMFSLHGLYFFLSTLLFVLPITSAAVFLGIVMPNIELISMLSTVLSLSQAFFAGAFVPREFLSNFIIWLGRVFPGSYTIRINNLIAEQQATNLGLILGNGGILIIYAAVFFGLSIFAIKNRYKKES
ncbi:MAG: ABC transporter permease [Bacilli bacterium]